MRLTRIWVMSLGLVLFLSSMGAPQVYRGPNSAVVTVTPSSAATRPYIFHYTKVAYPDDVITLQGVRFGASSGIVNLALVDDDRLIRRTKLMVSNGSILSRTDDSIVAVIPETYPRGMYALWITNGALTSDVYYINRAEVWWAEFSEIDPGREFRLFGLNLVPTDTSPTVAFDDGTNVIPGEVLTGGTEHYVTIRAPLSLVPATVYTIRYSNGWGGTLGQSSLAAPTVIATVVDTFSLGVPWAYHFDAIAADGDEVTVNAAGGGADDCANIRTAANAAPAEGRIINLPDALYWCETSVVSGSIQYGVRLKSNTIIRGGTPGVDGLPVTELRLNMGMEPTQDRYSTFHATDASQNIALINLRITTPETYANTHLRLGTHASNARYVLKNVKADANGYGLSVASMATITQVLIDECEFTRPKLSGVTMSMHTAGSEPVQGSMWVSVKNSRIQITHGLTGPYRNAVVENTEFFYDGDYAVAMTLIEGNQTEQRRIFAGALDTKWVAYLNNSMAQTGALAYYNNDGEIMNWQAVADNQQSGNLTSSTSTIVTHTGETWTVNILAGHLAYIASGTGYGQVRTIASNTANTFTVSPAWDVTPANGARYSVYKPSGSQTIVQGNSFQGGWRGIYVFQGGEEMVFADNTFADAYGIDLFARDSTSFFSPLFDMLVLRNTSRRTSELAVDDDTICTNAMFAVMSSASVTPNTPTGVAVINIMVRGNAIEARLPNLNYFCETIQVSPVSDVRHDGFIGKVVPSLIDEGGPWVGTANVNTVFDKNTAVNFDSAYVYSATGMRGFAIYKPININVTDITLAYP